MNCYSDFYVVIKEHGEDLQNIFKAYFKLALEATVEGDVDEIKKIVEANEYLDAGAGVHQRNGTEYALTAEENPNWDIIMPLVQIWMQRHDIRQPIAIEYNHSGDRPAEGVCGGGVFWIWQEDHFSIDTSDLVNFSDVNRLRPLFEK